jgi:hypothetical protein
VALQLATLVSIWNLSDGWIYYFFKLKWVLKIEAKPYTVAIFEAYLYFCLFNQSINLSVLIRIRRIAQWPSNYRRTHWPCWPLGKSGRMADFLPSSKVLPRIWSESPQQGPSIFAHIRQQNDIVTLMRTSVTQHSSIWYLLYVEVSLIQKLFLNNP